MITRVRKYLSADGLKPFFIRAVIGSAGLRLLGMLFGFLVGVQLARGLGVEGYGIYGTAVSLIAILAIPAEFGVPQLVTREVAAAQAREDWSLLKGVLRWATHTVIACSVVMVALTATGALFLRASIETNVLWAIAAGFALLPLRALSHIRGAALRGLHFPVKGQLPEVLIQPLSFSAFLGLADLFSVALTPMSAMLLGSASAATALGMAAFLLRKALPATVMAATHRENRSEWWKSSIPMALTEGIRVLQAHALILMLGTCATLGAVGIFRVASSIVLLIAVPVTLFNVIGAPMFAQLHARGDRRRLQRLLGWTAFGMSISTLVLSAPFWIAGSELLSQVFGPGFGAAHRSLLILSAGTVISACFGANAALLNMTGHEKRVTRAFGWSLVTLLLVAWPLGSRWLADGAAFASVISTLVWNSLMWWDARMLLRLDTSVISVLRHV